MKITKQQLQQIIKEELEEVMSESPLHWVLNQKRKQNMQRASSPESDEAAETPSPSPSSDDSQWRSQYLDKQARGEYSRRAAAMPQQVFDILKPQGLKVELQNGELVAKVVNPERPDKKFMMSIRLDPDLSPEENAQTAVDQINATDSNATRLRQGKKNASVNVADPFMESKKRIFKVRKK